MNRQFARHPNRSYPSSPSIRRWLRRSDLIGRMPRLQWEAYANRGRRPLIHKGGKP